MALSSGDKLTNHMLSVTLCWLVTGLVSSDCPVGSRKQVYYSAHFTGEPEVREVWILAQGMPASAGVPSLLGGLESCKVSLGCLWRVL